MAVVWEWGPTFGGTWISWIRGWNDAFLLEWPWFCKCFVCFREGAFVCELLQAMISLRFPMVWANQDFLEFHDFTIVGFGATAHYLRKPWPENCCLSFGMTHITSFDSLTLFNLFESSGFFDRHFLWSYLWECFQHWNAIKKSLENWGILELRLGSNLEWIFLQEFRWIRFLPFDLGCSPSKDSWIVFSKGSRNLPLAFWDSTPKIRVFLWISMYLILTFYHFWVQNIIWTRFVGTKQLLPAIFFLNMTRTTCL